MPLPLIAGVTALGAGAGYGAKKVYEGIKHGKKADVIIKESENEYNLQKQKFDIKNNKMTETLEDFGNLQLEIAKEFGEFKELAIELLDKINASSQKKEFKVSIPQYKLDQIENLSLSATTYLTQIARAGVIGAGAAYAVYGGVMTFTTASTGIVISSLSGVAAYNTTLAVGGGSLFTGLGMGVAQMLLGPIAVGTIFASAGFNYSKNKENKLEKAYEYQKESEKVVLKLKQAGIYLDNTFSLCSKINSSLEKIHEHFYGYFNELKTINIFLKRGGDINKFDDILINIIDNGYALAAILTDIITTPLFIVKTDLEGNTLIEGESILIEKDENGFNILNSKEINSVLKLSNNDMEEHI